MILEGLPDGLALPEVQHLVVFSKDLLVVPMQPAVLHVRVFPSLGYKQHHSDLAADTDTEPRVRPHLPVIVLSSCQMWRVPPFNLQEVQGVD